MTRKEQLLLAGFAVAICVGTVALVFHDRLSTQQVAETVVVREAEEATPTPRPDVVASAPIEAPVPTPEITPPISVAVKGAVRRPGVYELDFGSRVQDLIDAAGGALDEADLRDINLAAKLIDGSTLTLPVRRTALMDGRRLELRAGQQASAFNPPEYTVSGWHLSAEAPGSAPSTTPGNAASGAPASAANGLVNINTASAADLDTLPGVGPVTAQKIIDYRSRTPFTTIEDLMKVSGIAEKKFEAMRPLVTVR